MTQINRIGLGLMLYSIGFMLTPFELSNMSITVHYFILNALAGIGFLMLASDKK